MDRIKWSTFETMKEKEEKKRKEQPQEGKSIFSNIWGTKMSMYGLMIILFFLLAMVSLKYCDSKFVVVDEEIDYNIIKE